ncbi:MAG: exonuclease SbcCD subunit D [Raoultibacter sp.]
MAKKITFIHASDLHLGAPFRGLRALSAPWADRLLGAIAQAYDRVIDAALNNHVDFVVFAGDIFDTTRASYADYLHFFSGVSRLGAAGIPVYLCMGNHDPYVSWQHGFFALPENATMFAADKPSFATYARDGEVLALLGGRSYYNQAWPASEDISAGISRAAAIAATGVEAPFAVAVLHTGLHLDATKAPSDPVKLLARGMDYWALGHIHKRFVDNPANPRIAFSGCIQGRDIKETGERGVFLVTLEQGAPNTLEFIPTASVVWQRMQVDVTQCASIAEIGEKLVRELFRENGEARCEEMCTRITLRGTTPLHRLLSRPGVLDDLRKNINDAYPLFFCDALLDETVPPLDKAALAQEALFPAVFLQVSAAQREDVQAAQAFLQEEFVKKNLRLPRSVERKVSALGAAAENRVLDVLLGQGEGA